MHEHVGKALPNNVCPLCGKPNQCAPARTGKLQTPCWCTNARFPAELLARVPEEKRGKACICQACLAQFQAQAAGRAND